MYRVLRYPRICALCCAGSMLAAIARDMCLAREMAGWSNVLLIFTLLLLCSSFLLLSCRFLIDAQGVGVGFLLRVRHTAWSDLAAFGALCCNSRRLYLYGLYKPHPDFLHMLHRAPRCGAWGFVVPVSAKLATAVSSCCPWTVDLYTGMHGARKKGLHPVWHHAALCVLTSLAACTAAVLPAFTLLVRAAAQPSFVSALMPTLLSALLMYMTLRLLYRAYIALSTCPRISEQGVSAGLGLSLSWDEVRFGYVHRMARFSGLFLLSQPLCDIGKEASPPVRCLSMPDSSTLILAYLTYCPHASKGVEAKTPI